MILQTESVTVSDDKEIRLRLLREEACDFQVRERLGITRVFVKTSVKGGDPANDSCWAVSLSTLSEPFSSHLIKMTVLQPSDLN